MFPAISVIATLTGSGNALASTGWTWLLFFTAVPLLLVFFGGTPDTYHTAGLERGTATSTSTRPGTSSGDDQRDVDNREPAGRNAIRIRDHASFLPEPLPVITGT